MISERIDREWIKTKTSDLVLGPASEYLAKIWILWKVTSEKCNSAVIWKKSVQLVRAAFFRSNFLQNPYFCNWAFFLLHRFIFTKYNSIICKSDVLFPPDCSNPLQCIDKKCGTMGEVGDFCVDFPDCRLLSDY